MHETECPLELRYSSFSECPEADLTEHMLDSMIDIIRKDPEELETLKKLFNHENDEYLKIETTRIFIKVNQFSYVQPFLEHMLEPGKAKDLVSQLYVSLVLTSVNHQQGKQVLRNLIYGEDLREENQKNNNQDSICSDLEDIIERMGKHGHNVHIKQLIHDCARSSKFARIFYERFYQEKIDDPEVDA